DAGEGQAGDQGALEGARGAAGVAARRDGRALGERGAVRHREAYCELGRQVDVGQTAHAARTERRARPAALPDDRGVDDGIGFDALERIHLHAGAEDCAVADEALVADHDAFVDAGIAPQVSRPTDRAAAQPRAAPDIDVVVEDDSLEAGVGLHDDVGTEDGIRTELRARLDPAVVPDDDGAGDGHVRVDVGTLAQPDALAEAKARDVDLDLGVEDVDVGAQVGLGRTDVLPVAVGYVTENWKTVRQHRREDVAREVDDFALGNEVEHLGLEHVDAGVDGV